MILVSGAKQANCDFRICHSSHHMSVIKMDTCVKKECCEELNQEEEQLDVEEGLDEMELKREIEQLQKKYKEVSGNYDSLIDAKRNELNRSLIYFEEISKLCSQVQEMASELNRDIKPRPVVPRTEPPKVSARPVGRRTSIQKPKPPVKKQDDNIVEYDDEVEYDD